MPSESLMAPGEPPSLPVNGTGAEMARVYMETVGQYRRCEDQKAALVEALRSTGHLE